MARILLVEDEEALRVLAESILDEIGHQTTTAASTEQALALLESGSTFDLMFTDIGLGENLWAGLELAKQARNRHPELPVLYTTGQGVTDGMKAMFVDRAQLIPKPYTFEGLSTAIKLTFAKNDLHLGRVLINSPRCPLRSESDRVAASQRNDAMCQEATSCVASLKRGRNDPDMQTE